MTNAVNGEAVSDMVRHWLSTPVNRYYGSDYGSDTESLLQKPMSFSNVDAIIQKMKKDIPVLALIPNSVNIYMEEMTGRPDAKRILIEVLGEIIDTTDL